MGNKLISSLWNHALISKEKKKKRASLITCLFVPAFSTLKRSSIKMHDWKCVPAGFRMLVAVVLYLVSKAVPKSLVSRVFLCEGEACLGAWAEAAALHPQEGGLCLPPLAQQHLMSAVTVATLLCSLPINSWAGWPSSVLLLFSVYLTESLNKNRRKMSLGTRRFFTWSATIRLLCSGLPVFLFLFPAVTLALSTSPWLQTFSQCSYVWGSV